MKTTGKLVMSAAILSRFNGKFGPRECIRWPSTYFVAILAVSLFVYMPIKAIADLYFIPGDACFPSRLVENHVKNHEGRQSLEFVHETEHPGAFDSWGGFNYLRIDDPDGALRKNLKAVYERIRESQAKVVRVTKEADGNESQIEVNGPRILFYNRDVTVSAVGLGLMYNEEWHLLEKRRTSNDGRGGGVAIEHRTLVQTYDAAVEDWRDAHLYDGLNVDIPKDVTWWRMWKLIEEPVVANGSQIQAVVLDVDKPKAYFERKPGYEYYVVTTDGVEIHYWRGNKIRGKKLIVEDLDRNRIWPKTPIDQ